MAQPYLPTIIPGGGGGKIQKKHYAARVDTRASCEFTAKDVPLQKILPPITLRENTDLELNVDFTRVQRILALAADAFLQEVRKASTNTEDPQQRAQALATKFGKRWTLTAAASASARRKKEDTSLHAIIKQQVATTEASDEHGSSDCGETSAVEPSSPKTPSTEGSRRRVTSSSFRASKFARCPAAPLQCRRKSAPVEIQEYLTTEPPVPLTVSDFPPITPRRSNAERPSTSHYEYFAHKVPDGLRTSETRRAVRQKVRNLGLTILPDARGMRPIDRSLGWHPGGS